MNHVWNLPLPPHQKYVAIALADHAHDDGTEARPSQAYLANKTGLSERAIRRTLSQLVEAGVIIKARAGGRNRATSYTFVLQVTHDLQLLTDRRSPDTDRRSPTTGIAVTHDRLTIKNPQLNQSNTSSKNDPVTPATKAAYIAAARAALRGQSPQV